jgi:hypothetical protein
MTEQEWLECTDPMPMLEFLRGKCSDRKLRLFACACCGRIWHLLTDERSRKAVELATLYADGVASQEELAAAEERARQFALQTVDSFLRTTLTGGWGEGAPGEASMAAAHSAHRHAEEIYRTAQRASGAVAFSEGQRRRDAAIKNGTFQGEFYEIIHHSAELDTVARQREETHQALLLRDIFGNPFRPVTLSPNWLTSRVASIVQAIYDERVFDRLPGLVDALEEARCTDADLVAHCRSPGPHVRGCWVVDMLLGKE